MSNICPCVKSSNVEEFKVYECRVQCSCGASHSYTPVCKLCGRCLHTVNHRFE